MNRNLFTWPKKMVENIKRMDKIGRIIIIDNASTAEGTLDWYSSDKDLIIYRSKENLGNTGPWYSGIIKSFSSTSYIVTDPDLDLSIVPSDCMVHMRNVLINRPDLEKVGLSLLTQDVPHDSIYFNYELENLYWRCPKANWTFIGAAIDTTFCFYSASRLNDYKICGERLLPPYTARHIPWYYNSYRLSLDQEYIYYLKTSSHASSTKRMIDQFELVDLENL